MNKTGWCALFVLASLSVPVSTFAGPIKVTVNISPGNPVLEGNNPAGQGVTFEFTNNGAATLIGGAGTAVFPTTGDISDFAKFGALNYGACNPNGVNTLGTCTLSQPFTTDVLIPNEPVDTGTTVIRGGILLANGQMAFGQANVTVADPPFRRPRRLQR
jgi:hypothetical protein